jgi:hypothetical protein
MIDINLNYLKSAGVAELENGFFRDDRTDSFVCFFCGSKFEGGVVYPVGGTLLVARSAAARHVADAHGDVFDLLLDLGKQHTGISDVQKTVLKRIYDGSSDGDIARELGGKSLSTVRNHRYQLRKRQKEAKLFLALMNLIDKKGRNGGDFVDFRSAITVQDERVIVTTDEAEKIICKYFGRGEELTLLSFPRKQKTKLVILNRIAELFDRDRRYTEKEVNRILASVYGDYVTIRRYLIDYGFLDRKRDGSEYWLR